MNKGEMGGRRASPTDLALAATCPSKPHPCPLSHRPPADRERGTLLKRWCHRKEKEAIRRIRPIRRILSVTPTTNTNSSARSPSPGRWEGDGRGDRGEASEGRSPRGLRTAGAA